MVFEFKDMIKMEINSCKEINIDGMGEVTVLKVPRGWIYFYKNTSTFVPERDRRRNFGYQQRYRNGFNKEQKHMNESK